MSEIKYSFSLKYANGKLKNNTDSGNICIVQTEAKMTSTVQTIGYLAHEALCICDMSSVGVATFCNLDSTNNVSIGSDIPCTVAAASGTITVSDYTLLSGDSVVVDGTVLVEGVDWTAATDNETTAISLTAAIAAVVTVNAITVGTSSGVGNWVTITAVTAGTAGNSITMTTDDVDSGLTLSGETLTGGID